MPTYSAPNSEPVAQEGILNTAVKEFLIEGDFQFWFLNLFTTLNRHSVHWLRNHRPSLKRIFKKIPRILVEERLKLKCTAKWLQSRMTTTVEQFSVLVNHRVQERTQCKSHVSARESSIVHPLFTIHVAARSLYLVCHFPFQFNPPPQRITRLGLADLFFFSP